MHIEASLSLTRKPPGGNPESPLAPHLSMVQGVQRRLVAMVASLLELDHELYEIIQALPLRIDQGGMEDELIPMDVAFWLHTTLGQVKGQALRQVIDRLREASQRGEEDQRLAFYEGTRS